MRVRYGKPIKVKSLVGKQDSLLYNSQAESLSMLGVGNEVCLKQGSAYIRNIGAGVNVSLNSVHKYFIFMQIIGTLNNTNFNIYYANDDTQLSLDITQYKNLQDKTVCALLTNETKFRTSHLYTWDNSFDSTSLVKYYFLIDLTEIGLDNLTAQEFYNKYNKYFPLIATGEEITIDDKAGQVSLGPKLPLEYQEVEYIQSTGTQYIDTGYKLNDASNVEISFSFTNITRQSRVFGSQANGSTSYLAFSCYINGSGYIAFNLGYINGSSGISTYPSNVTAETNTIYNVLMNKNKISINDNIVITNINPASGFTYYNAQLFRCIGATDPMYDAYQLIGKIYSCKIYDNSILVRDFIPCYRKSDNEIGMYDLVNRVFYTNQGTGTFLKGNNVNNTISCKIAGGSSDIYYGYNQQIENGQFENGTDRWFMQNGTFSITDGVATFTQTDLNVAYTRFTQKLTKSTIIGHKYFVHFYGKHNLSIDVNLRENSHHNTNRFTISPNKWTLCETISLADTGAGYATISTRNAELNNTKCDVDIKDYMLIDLTDWYGAGKEPSTLQEFKEKFTKEYYGFCPTPIKLTRYQIEALPTYGYNQYCSHGNFDSSSGWYAKGTGTQISISNNECICTPTGATYPGITRTFNGYQANHKMIYILDIWSDSNNVGKSLCINNGTGLNTSIGTLKLGWNTYSKITTLSESKNVGTAFFIYQPALYSIKFRNIIAIDLTDWYGEGNEPTTVAEFKATFPNKYYPFSKKRLLNKYMINKLEN